MNPEQIKQLRSQLQMSQKAFAAVVGVSFATVNRWENGKAKPQSDRIQSLRALALESELPTSSAAPLLPFMQICLDFEGDADAVKLVVDAHRIQNGHIFNKAFGLDSLALFRFHISGLRSTSRCCPRIPSAFLLG